MLTDLSERTEGPKHTKLSAWNRSRNPLLWYKTRALGVFLVDNM